MSEGPGEGLLNGPSPEEPRDRGHGMEAAVTPRIRVRAHGCRARSSTEAAWAYLFLAPDVLGLVIFVVGPALYAFYLSLHDWNPFGAPAFAGLENYAALMSDSRFWKALRTTSLYVVMYVPAVFTLSLALALLVQQRLPGIGLFRTAYFVPVATSLVVVSIVWNYMFESSYGFLNYLLGLIGIPPQRWIGSTSQALPSVALVGVWKQMGYYMVIFLAGLQDIPRELYEAARVDGASGFQAFRHITWPLLAPTRLFVVVTLLIGSFQVFDQVYVMTRGGPAYATYVLMMYIYETAFRFSRLGYAAAMTFVLFILILMMTLLQMRVIRLRRGEDV